MKPKPTGSGEPPKKVQGTIPGAETSEKGKVTQEEGMPRGKGKEGIIDKGFRLAERSIAGKGSDVMKPGDNLFQKFDKLNKLASEGVRDFLEGEKGIQADAKKFYMSFPDQFKSFLASFQKFMIWLVGEAGKKGEELISDFSDKVNKEMESLSAIADFLLDLVDEATKDKQKWVDNKLKEINTLNKTFDANVKEKVESFKSSMHKKVDNVTDALGAKDAEAVKKIKDKIDKLG